MNTLTLPFNGTEVEIPLLVTQEAHAVNRERKAYACAMKNCGHHAPSEAQLNQLYPWPIYELPAIESIAFEGCRGGSHMIGFDENGRLQTQYANGAVSDPCEAFASPNWLRTAAALLLARATARQMVTVSIVDRLPHVQAHEKL
jgi:hypothetical protein